MPTKVTAKPDWQPPDQRSLPETLQLTTLGQAAMPGWWWNTLGLVFGTGLGMWLVDTIPGPW